MASNPPAVSMKVPSCVLWSLTKKNSAFKVQPKGSKSRLQCFSNDPLNLTGFHNASSQGYTQVGSVGLTAQKADAKKKFNREFVLKVHHKSYHKTSRVSKNTHGAAHLVASTQTIKKGTAHAAKTIQGLTFANDKKKALLLKRLGKLHAATRVNVKGDGKK
eukprot:CAMPEP_0170480536 /NCGR_PEP_ID=MMETSP0208-20121228/1338_1 /TAXON_ID=197538 /ORGANISM="Strombidium inclinatum, Strain S3" /LENGTH=160 /DNA_ID=CAMNT_0010753099 /DNA_START=57 /DNA_END=540 /DNA_ORIENTATION=+